MPLRVASPEEKIALDKLTFAAWGTGLDQRQYLVREERLRRNTWAARDLKTYMLVDEAGAALSSCEAYRMQSFLDGQRGTTYGIASVFTEERLRGRGYATRLLSELSPILEASEPNVHASVLYSDVGAPIYERPGYVARPAQDLIFEPQPGDPTHDVDALIDAKDLEAAVARISPPSDRYFVFPSVSQVDWHLERERTYADLLRRDPLPACGARAGASTMLWMARLQYASMIVLLVDSGRADELRALVNAACRIAHGSGIRDVTLWLHGAPYERLLDGEPRRERDGGLPMIRPFARDLEPTEWRFIPRALWV